jgi:hypothetical protein
MSNAVTDCSSLRSERSAHRPEEKLLNALQDLGHRKVESFHKFASEKCGLNDLSLTSKSIQGLWFQIDRVRGAVARVCHDVNNQRRYWNELTFWSRIVHMVKTRGGKLGLALGNKKFCISHPGRKID